MDTTDSFVCEECGNSTSVPGQICPNCGGRLTSLDHGADLSSDSVDEELADDDRITDEGHTSLESLRDQEEEEETPASYGN